MAVFYRLSSLARGYDISLGYNRLILLLTLAGAAVGLVIAQAFSLRAALVGAATVFFAAALAKEIDPDHPQSAVLAAALGLPAVWIATWESLPALLWLLLTLRWVNRSTGLPPKVTDTLGLLALAGVLTWFGSPLFALLTGGVLVLDALLPDGRRARLPLGVVVIIGAVVYWVLNADRFAPQPHEPWLAIALLAITLGLFSVILSCYVILMPGDATGRPLNSARFQAAQVVALAVGLSFASWHGHEGAALFVALWAALLGAVVMHWVYTGQRHSAALL